MTINYKNGKIYKIEPLNGEEGDIYIGSTTKEYLSQRMTAHRGGYKSWKNGKGNKLMSFDLFEKYGAENCCIILLENCPCESKDELHAKESHHIRTLNCVNKVIPGRTKKEWRNENQDYLLEYAKKYRETNKEKILEKLHDFKKINKDKIEKRRQEYILEQIKITIQNKKPLK